jgi:hypothetical protein
MFAVAAFPLAEAMTTLTSSPEHNAGPAPATIKHRADVPRTAYSSSR